MLKVICNVNNNAVEGFNSVVAKYVGGKQVNFYFRGILTFIIINELYITLL